MSGVSTVAAVSVTAFPDGVLLFVVLVGFATGSFLNVVVFRCPAGRSVVHPPSACPGCSTPIRPYDNIPVLSWFVLRGRCRSCDDRISFRYPAVEFACGALWFVTALAIGPTAALPAHLAATAGLLALTLIDVDTMRVPDNVLIPTTVLTAALFAVAAWWEGWDHLVRAGIGGVAAFAVFLAIHKAVPHGLGFGDVKLAFCCGMLLGWHGLASVFLGLLAGVFLGAVVGLALIPLRRTAFGAHLPFVPFMAAGAWLVALWGEPVVDAWLGSGLGSGA